MDFSAQIEQLLEANIHAASYGGMQSSRYRGLWPMCGRPKGYDQRFPLPLLVDNTVFIRDLVSSTRLLELEDPNDFVDIDTVRETEGFHRYILWVQNGNASTGDKPKSAVDAHASDERPLTLRQGLFFALQYPEYLTRAGIDLAGSRFSTTKDIAGLSKHRGQGGLRLRLQRRKITRPHPIFGMPSRGLTIFPAM